MTRQPLLALTMGDPAGIGPEITCAAWETQRRDGQHFVLLADPVLFEPHIPIHVIENPQQAHDVFADALPILPIPLAVPVTPGTPDSANAHPVIESIRRAVALALAGEVDGVVTNPISKAVLRHGGFPHPGHTEFLGELCGTPGAEVMMLACPELRVVPVTVHVSLRHALDQLNTEMIQRVARTTAAALRRDFGIASPRLALAGLNPHAGEGGMMGTEEIEMIIPAIELLRAEGFEVIGPMPPDTMFTPAARARYDAALCMYHDQALIPIKTINMAQGVNVTLGLPIIRTSPDHGTAFDIAGRNIAEAESLVASLRLADQLARNRRSAA